MYTEFLQGLADLSKLLTQAAQLGGDLKGMPTPYLYGKVEVRLDDTTVGYFEFVDEWVQYESVKEAKDIG